MAGSCSHQCWEAETGRSPNSQLSQVCRICEPQVQWQMVSENKTENDRGWYSMLTWFQTHVDTCAHTWTCTHIHSQRHINIKILCLLITNCCCLIFNFFLIDWDPPPQHTQPTHTHAHRYQCMCGKLRKTFGGQASPSTLWISETGLRWLDLVIQTFSSLTEPSQQPHFPPISISLRR